MASQSPSQYLHPKRIQSKNHQNGEIKYQVIGNKVMNKQVSVIILLDEKNPLGGKTLTVEQIHNQKNRFIMHIKI